MQFKSAFCFAMLLTLVPAAAYAIMCPTNFNQINIGDSIDQINQQCGKPDKQTSKDVTPEGPQEWSYFMSSMGTNNISLPSNGTFKTTVAFDKDGKAINISVNGVGISSTQVCGNTISLGDSRDSVKANCGDPSYVNKQQPSDADSKPTKVVTYIYNTNPPTTLTFENGKLTQREP